MSFLQLVQAEFERAARDGDEYTLPWLDLDVEAYRAYREGRTGRLPDPYQDDPAQRLMLSGVQGQQVLALAAGGGQQSAVFSLLGAHVTVLDLMPGQLAGDLKAAAHYGYTVTTLQGDMHDLSGLPASAFDRVHQPISTLYCYDLARLYAGVYRVLKPGGLYYVDFAFPLLYMAQNLGWDEQRGAYLLAVGEPYQRGSILEDNNGRSSFTQGKPIGEYHHLLSDILNGLIQTGFVLCGVWESPRPGQPASDLHLPAGIPAHLARYLPFGLSIVAAKK